MHVERGDDRTAAIALPQLGPFRKINQGKFSHNQRRVHLHATEVEDTEMNIGSSKDREEVLGGAITPNLRSRTCVRAILRGHANERRGRVLPTST
jgi:hypothetical protein